MKTLFLGGYRVMVVLGVMNRQTRLLSLVVICLESALGYRMLILKITPVNIFFPLGKIIRMVSMRKSFNLLSRSWEISSHFTGGVIVCCHTHFTHSYILKKRIHCLRVSSSPHFGGVQLFCQNKERKMVAAM